MATVTPLYTSDSNIAFPGVMACNIGSTPYVGSTIPTIGSSSKGTYTYFDDTSKATKVYSMSGSASDSNVVFYSVNNSSSAPKVMATISTDGLSAQYATFGSLQCTSLSTSSEIDFGALTVSGTLGVTGAGTFGSSLSAQAGQFTSCHVVQSLIPEVCLVRIAVCK